MTSSGTAPTAPGAPSNRSKPEDQELAAHLRRVTKELMQERDLSMRLMRELVLQQRAIAELYQNSWNSAPASALNDTVIAARRIARQIARRAKRFR